MARENIVAALDVGSTKVCCFVARVPEEGRYDVVGIGDRASRGILEGAVVDIQAAGQTIATAISHAERMAGVEVQQIYVATSGGRPTSQRIRVEVPVAGPRIVPADIRGIQNAAYARIDTKDRRLLLVRPLDYTVDGVDGIENPLGMYGSRIGIDLHAITAEAGPIANLEACVKAAHVEVAGILPAPYTAGLAVLSEEDRELGIAVADMGGGTTGIAVFNSRGVTFVDVLKKGGARLTEDVAYAFSLSFREAEEIKVKEASCLSGSPFETDPLQVPNAEASFQKNGHHSVPPYLRQIVTPRAEQTFERVRARLEETYASTEAGRRVVLTGGASQLVGAARLGELILERQIRTGSIGPAFRIADSRVGPAYAACAGLLVHAGAGNAVTALSMPTLAPASTHLFARFGAWMRQHI